MIRGILLVGLLTLASCQVQAYEVKRTGGYVYVCRDSAGEIPDTNHNEWQALANACGKRADQHGRVFDAIPGAVYRFTPEAPVDPDDPPVIVDPDPDPVENPVAQFSVVATGFPEAWPLGASEAMEADVGRMVYTFSPETVTDGGQRMLYGENFGIWLWTHEIHGHIYRADGTRLLWRARGDWADPVEPGSQHEVIVTWWFGGVGILIDGSLRLYVEGATAPRSAMFYGGIPASDKDGFNGTIDIKVYAGSEDIDDVCWNVDEWATVNNQPATRPAECLVDVTLEWTPPTEYADGTPLPPEELQKYHVYDVDTGHVLEIPAPAHEFTLTGRLPGTCYEMTAVADLLESVRSNRACK